MAVQSYLFQSPYSSPIQIGRPDPSVKQDTNSDMPNTTNETLQKAQSFAATQTKDVVPTVTSNQLLDLYA